MKKCEICFTRTKILFFQKKRLKKGKLKAECFTVFGKLAKK